VNVKMKKIYLLLLLGIVVVTSSSFLMKPVMKAAPRMHEEVPASIADTFPVPSASVKRLYYLQRTHNTNTIVYALNYNADSTINEKDPIHVYWIRYADKGETKELSYIQKNYAYGVNCVSMDKDKQMYKVTYVSYKKRDIYLVRSKTGHAYNACLNINNKMAYLNRIFLKIDGGSFWLPHITYVEVTGKDIASGKPVSERIIP